MDRTTVSLTTAERAAGPFRRRPSADDEPSGTEAVPAPAPVLASVGAGTGIGADMDDDVDVDVDESGYQPLWVRLACILLDFLTQTYDQIRIVPEIVLFERWLCNSHFPPGEEGLLLLDGGRDHLCRTPDIQYELAQLRSWKAFFDGVASMELPAYIERRPLP